MNMNRWFAFILASFIVTGCSATTQRPPTQQSLASPSIIYASATPSPQIPTATPTPSQTPTSLPPSSTPNPSPSPLPTDSPIPTLTPVPWGKVPLSVENTSSIVQKSVWGLGSPQKSAFSTSGDVFIQGTNFGIYLYQTDTLKLIRYLPNADQFILSPAGDLLFTRLPDGTIQVIDLPSGQTRYDLAPIATLSPWMKDAIYAQLPADRPNLEAEYFNQVSSMSGLAINSSNTLVAIGFGDASIGLWNLTTGEFVNRLSNVVVQDVSSLVFSPNGEKLLSSGWSGVIAVWQVEDGQLLWRQRKIGHAVGQPFSMDGSLLVLEITQETSSWVSLRDARYGDELAPRIVAAVDSQAISPDNSLLVTSWYGTVKLWSIPNLVFQSKIETGLAWAHASFSDDGRFILVNGGEQAYMASDLSRDETYRVTTQPPASEPDYTALQQIGHLSGMIGIRYPQPDQAFAWGTLSDHEAWVLDVANNIQNIYDFYSPFIADPNLSFDGDRIAACTDAGLVVLSLANDESSNFGPCREPTQVLFSPDGKIIFRASIYNIDALNSSTGELLYNLVGHSYPIEGMAIVTNGKYLLSSSVCKRGQGREVFWWQVDEPKQVLRWMESVFPYDYLYTADFDPSENVLYAALGGLRSWRLSDGQPDHLDTNEISSLALSVDNHLLATGDFDGLIHIWSVDSWQELAVLSGHKMRIEALAFSPDGSSLLSMSTDGTIRLWAAR